jgi:undecaprenyl-diphosphatase
VFLVISISIVGEYIDETHIPQTFPEKDNFPTQLSSWDTTLFLWVNVDLSNHTAGQILLIVTLLGSFSASMIVCGFLFLSGDRRRGITASTSTILVTVLTIIIKTIVARPRPFTVVPGVIAVVLETGSSFPSGHVSRVFSLLHVTRGTSKRLRVVGYSLASLVMFSRVYLGVHYPLDVLCGALLGYASGRVVQHYEKWLVPKVEGAMGRLKLVSPSNP